MNACFSTDNSPGQLCKDTIRGVFQIPTGGPWLDIGVFTRLYKVTYFKYAAKIAYVVTYSNEENGPLTWHCNCPEFQFGNRAEAQTCCKHIQAVIDKKNGVSRTGGDYEQFLVEHVQ